jgi:hypothetical protein
LHLNPTKHGVAARIENSPWQGSHKLFQYMLHQYVCMHASLACGVCLATRVAKHPLIASPTAFSFGA